MGNERLSWLDRWRLYRDRLIARSARPALGLGEPADPPCRAATRPGHARSLRGIRLLTGPLHLREAAPLRHPVQGAPDRCRTCREAVAFARSYVPPPRRCGFTWAGGAAWPILLRAAAAWRGAGWKPGRSLPDRTSASAVRRSPGSGSAASGVLSGYGDRSLLALLGGRTSNELTAEEVAPYSALMAASQPLIAQEVLDSYPIHRHRCLLDVGGGEGVFLTAAATRAPALRLMLLDLPAVAKRARARLADAGLLERASIHGGNFLTGPMPEGADVISLIRIVHDHDNASALSLLRAVHRALPPNGTLLIAEAMWAWGRRIARRLLWILHPRHGPRRAKDRRGDQQVAAASRLQPLSSSAQPNAHPNQHPRRPADFELRIGFTMRATVRAGSLRTFLTSHALQPIENVSGFPTA